MLKDPCVKGDTDRPLDSFNFLDNKSHPLAELLISGVESRIPVLEHAKHSFSLDQHKPSGRLQQLRQLTPIGLDFLFECHDRRPLPNWGVRKYSTKQYLTNG